MMVFAQLPFTPAKHTLAPQFYALSEIIRTLPEYPPLVF